jgi:hypothetical protein
VKYLIFPDFASAQSRSHQQAIAKGCTGETQYWWECIANVATGQGAVGIADSGDYDSSGLTEAEVAALVLLDPNDLNWFPNT